MHRIGNSRLTFTYDGRKSVLNAAEEAGLSHREYWVLQCLALHSSSQLHPAQTEALAKLSQLGFIRRGECEGSYELTKTGLGVIASAQVEEP
jgi:hypothetical protein